MSPELDAAQLIGCGRAAGSRKPDSGHIGTISNTIRVRRASWNAMKPRIQGVLTQWKPGSSASGSGRRRSRAGQSWGGGAGRGRSVEVLAEHLGAAWVAELGQGLRL